MKDIETKDDPEYKLDDDDDDDTMLAAMLPDSVTKPTGDPSSVDAFSIVGNPVQRLKFGFIYGVDNVSSVSPSSERIEGLWVTCSFYSRIGATLLVVTWQREK